MINKKKLIEDIFNHENVLADANYYYKQGYDVRQREILNIIERQPVIDAEGVDKAYLELAIENQELKKRLEFGGWILADECVPSNDDYILLSFENFSLPQIGRYQRNKDGGSFYIGNDEHSCSSYGLFVDAWQPCPKGYMPRGKERRYEGFETGWKKAMMDTFLGSRNGDVQ